MKTKPTSYQKLKAENLKLKQDIFTLVMEEDKFLKHAQVKITWKNSFQLESVIWSGEISNETIKQNG